MRRAFVSECERATPNPPPHTPPMKQSTNPVFDALNEDWQSNGLPFTIPVSASASQFNFYDEQWHRNEDKVFVPDPYVNWLSSTKWDWFFTITSRYEMTLPSSRRVAHRFADAIQRYGSGSLSTESRDGWLFWCAEPHKHSSDGFHLHGLYKRPFPRFSHWGNKAEFTMLLEEARRAVGGQKWENQKGELGLWHRVRLEPYKGRTGAEYAAKYLNKGCSDWDAFQVKHRF